MPIEDPQPGSYDAIILAVAHRQFREMGIEWLRAWGRPGAVFFDVKHVFPAISCGRQTIGTADAHILVQRCRSTDNIGLALISRTLPTQGCRQLSASVDPLSPTPLPEIVGARRAAPLLRNGGPRYFCVLRFSIIGSG